jgi:hypothetical protein
MNIDRIPAIVPSPGPRPRTGANSRLPVPGETLLLTHSESVDEVLATTAGGASIRLTGLDALSRALQPGDTLTARVLALNPVLELQLFSARPENARPLTLSDHPAMRLDLAELRTVIWRAPNAAALALSWQAQSSAHSLFPVYAWNGVQWAGMRMNLTLGRPDEESSRAPRRRRSLALRIELLHPALGCIVFEVEWRSGGIELTLAVEAAAAAQAVRSALPAIVSALSHANLRLARVRMTRGSMPVLPALAPALPARTAMNDEGLERRLFRAAAETVVALLSRENPRC